jgi:beta-galactosidase
MNKQPRRRFLKQLGTASATVALTPALLSGAPANSGGPFSDLATGVIPLECWSFALDPEGRGESQGWFESAKDRPGALAGVKVPHTWQISSDSAGYAGAGWYWTEFDAPSHGAGQCVRVEFEAAFHTAKVWLNGQLLGEHPGRGYTAFTFDATPALRFDGRNLLAVKVDNSFKADILPRNNSYDWAQDGGLTRPVSLLVTPGVYIERLWVDAVPDLDAGHTPLKIRAAVHNSGKETQELSFSYSVVEDGSAVALASVQKAGGVRLEAGATQEVELTSLEVPLKLWHFDHPHLYRTVVTMAQGAKPLHSCSQTFGSRKFEVKDTAFYLNGERVRLMGVERMAGSHPEHGMAEPSGWITHDHDDLKELNCVFTRVHWQQDKRVLEYCDRHGILIQEEIPTWGRGTFEGMTNEPTPGIMQNGLEQLREMIKRDGNHPCIGSWGLCNEVDGQNPVSKVFIRRMAEEARRLDPHRLLSYASDSLRKNPGDDAAGLLDFIEFNEYYESWYPGSPDAVGRNLQQIHEAFPHKPVVISEYGFCECAPGPGHLGGDARRIEILRNHTRVCREFDFVAGAIFFDYNDYRTHIGDKGTGPLKQRVHGVVDLYGNRKPSFEALREESSPIESLQIAPGVGSLSATVATRRTLPAYTLEGYTLRWIVFGFDDLPMEGGAEALPKLSPGQHVTIQIKLQEKHPRRVRVDIMRPAGLSAHTAWWKNAT